MTPSVSDYKSKTEWEAEADVVVVGSGVAGLTAALRAAELGLRVLVVTKGRVTDGNTRWAQGGVAAVLDDGRTDHGRNDAGSIDSIDAHVADTLRAGAGLCDPDVVRTVVASGAAAVKRLRSWGARFDIDDEGRLARTREGGHSAFRVIHAGGDATGAEVQRCLVATARREGLTVLEQHIAVAALTTETGAVRGVRVLATDVEPAASGIVRAGAVVLATGGHGQLYQATSNPELATGDGLALALRAGASAADLEFVQFHPTVLYTPGARGRCPLITEAVRGEGAVLVDAAGKPVMRGVHPLEDLAPRDVVSAAIARRLASAPGGVADHVFLDATGIPDFARRFPTVLATCVAAGVDPRREPIPVAPAAHFACGGVVTDTHGRTDVTGLYAVGEVARTGLHGANRLASNSLLEGLVLGRRAAEAVAADLASGESAAAVAECDPSVPIAPVAERSSLQRLLSRYAGIGRDAEGLAVAGSALDVSTTDVPLWTSRAVEDAALTLVARALLVAAAARTESRGCHVRTDHPDRDDRGWRRSQTIRLNPSGQPVLADPILEDVA